MKLMTLALALTVSAAPALAASPPPWCAGPRLYPDETAICDNAFLWRKDLLLWKRYHAFLGVQRAHGRSRAAAAAAYQRDWIKKERRACRTNVICLVKAYDERIENLQEMVGDIEDND